MNVIKKVNLGCGPIGKEDWINIDWGILAFLHKYHFVENFLLACKLFPKGYNIKWPKNLFLHNCRSKLPFKEGSIDFIYSSHFIEHMRRFETERILKDCYRVLKKGGVMRLVIPDLELLTRKYIEKDKGFFYALNNLLNNDPNPKDEIFLADVLLDSFFPVSYKKPYQGIHRLYSFFIRPHLWMYDFNSLEGILKNAGFGKIRKLNYREGKVPDLDKLDVFPEISLYVEAEK